MRFCSHPQLLVPEQQFAAGLVELQPVDLGVVADGSQVGAGGQIHWRSTETDDSERKMQRNKKINSVSSCGVANIKVLMSGISSKLLHHTEEGKEEEKERGRKLHDICPVMENLT